MRRILGADVPSELRPLLAVFLLGAITMSAFFTFAGIWALKVLHAGEGRLGVAFTISAIASILSGYLGGHLSDHVGRRRVMLIAHGLLPLILPFALVVTADTALLGLGLFVLIGAAVSLANGADTALVADLVAPEGRERAYATVRVASNLGAVIGPLVAAGLLLIGWAALFLGISVLAVALFAVAWRFIPSGGAYAPETAPKRSSARVILGDRPFLLFMVAGVLASITYLSYETLLPISLTVVHSLPTAAWGLLLVVNPLAVTLLQLRITRRVEGVPAGRKLAVGLILMGTPFLLVPVSQALWFVALLIGVFVLGEMLWVPASQALLARLAPEDVRGAYMGAFGATSAVGFALGPLIGLQVLSRYGETAMWLVVCAVSITGAVLMATVAAMPAVRRRTDSAAAPT